MSFKLNPLPPTCELESKTVLRQAVKANRRLAELKGLCPTIPNQAILINTLALQEAKDSSAIENIITTQDDLFKETAFPEFALNAAAKEVANYVSALHIGHRRISETRMLTANHVVEIQAELERNRAGFRKLPGTALKNQDTGEVVYTPPQDHGEIVELMANLERFINDDDAFEADPLVKMAILHYQFESIHPFYDGNGRTGRILNVLYLVLKGLLDIPVLYLSRYIIRTKDDYYRLLQQVRGDGDWESWILYMLTAVENTSAVTIRLVNGMRQAMEDYRDRIRGEFKFYSQDLINNLFFHPYTKIEFVEKDLKVSRLTAAKYLAALSEAGLLRKEKLGRSNYFINLALFNLLLSEEERA